MRLVLIGAPGVGKGTQAALLSGKLGVPHISTGALFREQVERGTALGRAAARHLDAGELVPDEMVGDLVRERLAQPDARAGFLLDGYPRTLPQAHALDAVLDRAGWALDAVVELTAPEEVLVGRLLSRARPDDTEDVIRHRQRVYRRQTAPLLAHYADLVLSVRSVGAVEEIAGRVLNGIAAEAG